MYRILKEKTACECDTPVNPVKSSYNREVDHRLAIRERRPRAQLQGGKAGGKAAGVSLGQCSATGHVRGRLLRGAVAGVARWLWARGLAMVVVHLH